MPPVRAQGVPSLPQALHRPHYRVCRTRGPRGRACACARPTPCIKRCARCFRLYAGTRRPRTTTAAAAAAAAGTTEVC